MDRIGDEEILYRSVDPCYCRDDPFDKVTSGAFLDPEFRPSVDRAELCPPELGPRHTQRKPADGVISLVAGEVRQIKDVTRSKQNVTLTYLVDVEPDPLLGNPAHARIFLHPDDANDGTFRRLRKRLAHLANRREWVIKPPHIP